MNALPITKIAALFSFLSALTIVSAIPGFG